MENCNSFGTLFDKMAYSFLISDSERAADLRRINNMIQEYKIYRKLTAINSIMKNGDYTTVLWADGTKTIVKKATDEKDDPDTALAYAILKKLKGNNASAVRRYFEDARKKTFTKEKKKKK